LDFCYREFLPTSAANTSTNTGTAQQFKMSMNPEVADVNVDPVGQVNPKVYVSLPSRSYGSRVI